MVSQVAAKSLEICADQSCMSTSAIGGLARRLEEADGGNLLRPNDFGSGIQGYALNEKSHRANIPVDFGFSDIFVVL